MTNIRAYPGIPLSDAERQDRLLATIAFEVSRRGARVESQTQFSAVLSYGHQPNHILHLLLTVITCGAWLLIWALSAVCNKELRISVRVDPYGEMIVN